jgi:hypothetical protein
MGFSRNLGSPAENYFFIQVSENFFCFQQSPSDPGLEGVDWHPDLLKELLSAFTMNVGDLRQGGMSCRMAFIFATGHPIVAPSSNWFFRSI